MATAITSPGRAAEASAQRLPALACLWHLLSLDAPCVAAVWTIFFARRFAIMLTWTAPAALALAVWMLYALDRLADAARPRDTLAERHRFHHRHRAAFAGALLGAMPVLILLIALLPHALRAGWLLLALPLAAYVAIVHILHVRRIPKEHIVAIFFALATAMPVLVHQPAAQARLIPAMILFGALCWLNCVAIARWEHARNADAATLWAAAHFRTTITAVLLTIGALLLTVPAIGAACALSACLLLLLEYTRPNTLLLRALADAALLTPLLVLPFLR